MLGVQLSLSLFSTDWTVIFASGSAIFEVVRTLVRSISVQSEVPLNNPAVGDLLFM
jgi:hypothetical protein